MALVECKECGKEVSDKAKVCPHCGIETPTAVFGNTEDYPIMRWNGPVPITLYLIVILIVWGLSLSQKPVTSDYQEVVGTESQQTVETGDPQSVTLKIDGDQYKDKLRDYLVSEGIELDSWKENQKDARRWWTARSDMSVFIVEDGQAAAIIVINSDEVMEVMLSCLSIAYVALGKGEGPQAMSDMASNALSTGTDQEKVIDGLKLKTTFQQSVKMLSCSVEDV